MMLLCVLLCSFAVYQFFRKMDIKQIIQSEPIGENITVKGWVRTFRSNRFVALNDGSTVKNLQVVVDFEK